jgi:hypothetical protein
MFQQPTRYRKDVAERLTSFEPHHELRTREQPIHRERVRRPIGLDDTGQRRQAVLRPVERPGREEVDTRLCTEQTRDIEGEDPMSEVAEGGRRRTGIGRDVDGFLVCATVPVGGEARRRKNLPAVRIGNVQRQTAIGETLIGRVHPRAFHRRRPHINGVTVDDVGNQLRHPLARPSRQVSRMLP